jgi:hypothetical protein
MVVALRTYVIDWGRRFRQRTRPGICSVLRAACAHGLRAHASLFGHDASQDLGAVRVVVCSAVNVLYCNGARPKGRCET